MMRTRRFHRALTVATILAALTAAPALMARSDAPAPPAPKDKAPERRAAPASTAPAPKTAASPRPVPPTGGTIVLSGGVVSEAASRPIAGARVDAYLVEEPDAARERKAKGEFIASPIARITADASGSFSLAVPRGARVALAASAPGFARSRGRSLLAISDRDLGKIELPEGRRVSGRVIDPDGQPIAGAQVIALVPRAQRPAGGGSFLRRIAAAGSPPFPVSAVTGPDGAFTLESVTRRAVTLRAYAEGFAPGMIEDAPSSGVSLRLSRGVAVGGKVVGPDGKTPAPGAWVLAGDDGWDGVARSGADGAFELPNLRPGEASLTATVSTTIIPGAAGAKSAAAESSWAPSAPAAIAVPAKSPATLRLRAGGIVRARAIDSEERKAVEGASIWLTAPGESEPRSATTASAGEAIFTGVASGNVSLHAEAEGYFEQNLAPSALAAGQTRSLSAAMRPAAEIEGIVRDASGRPIAGATVTLSGPPPFQLPMRLPLFFPLENEPAVSDALGRFRVDLLPPRDELKVSVSCPGYAPWEEAGIKLRPGERRKGMEILLDAGTTIAGRLVNADGQGIAGASVIAWKRSQESGPTMVFRMGGRGGPGGRGGGRLGGRGGPEGSQELPGVTSGPDGSFRVRGASTGLWTLDVTAAGYAPKSVAGLKVEDARGLEAGDIALDPGARLQGRVVSAAGTPIPYARGAVRKDFDVLSEFTSGPDGDFQSGDLAEGDTVSLSIDADGYAAVEKAGLKAPAEDLVITLPASSSVTGTVQDEETRRPIPDFSVATSRSRSGGGAAVMMNMQMMGPETSFHADDGAFRLDDVDPGKVSVIARAPGYREAVLRDQEIPEGKDLTGLVFNLERAAVVSGTVVDEKGQPVPGVNVEKKEKTQGMGMMVMRGGPGGRAVTDGEGSFVLDGLDRGALTLGFSHPDYEPGEQDVDTTHDVQSLRVTLSRGGTIAGIVLHQEDGSAVARATVTAIAAGADRFSGARSATSGPDGAFTIEGLSAGRYSLRAEATGLTPASIDNVVVSGGSTSPPYELKLGGGVALTGTITGVKEKDLPQFTVRAFGGRGGFGKTAPVDASGRFEMQGLTPGSITLVAGSGLFGGRSATKDLEIPEGRSEVETTIEFPKGNTVEGLVSRGGTPVAGASVIFRNGASSTSDTGTTDASGHYEIEDLEPGSYDVNVMSFASGLSFSTKVAISGDRSFDIELPLAKLAGWVRDAETNKPIDGASISIKKEGGEPVVAGRMMFLMQQGARTDATGYWSAEGLDEGSYTLTATKDGYAFEERPVTIIPNVDPDEVSFSLDPGEAITFRALDPVTGGPLKALRAMVLTGGTGDPLGPKGSGAKVVRQVGLTSDASGLFHIEGLRPGTYRVVLEGTGIAMEVLDGVKVPVQDLVVPMSPGGSGVEVTVNGLADGQQAKGVIVDDHGRPVYPSTFSAEPAFVLGKADDKRGLDDVKPGRYRARVALPGGGVAEKEVTVEPGATAKIAFP